MTRARLGVGIQNAMRSVADEPERVFGEAPRGDETEPSPSETSGQAILGEGPRGRLRTTFGKLVDPLRLWFGAPIQRRLIAQAELEQRLEAALGRIEQAAAQSLGTLVHQSESLVARIDAFSSRTQSFVARTDAFSARTENFVARTDAFAARTDNFATRTGGTLTGLEVAMRTLSDGLSRIAQEQIRQQTIIAGLSAFFGPRLDELEVKLRPLIPFDEASWAVRLRDGYVMVPRDKPVFATALVDATSEGLEPGTRRVLQALAQPGGGAADVGANIGLLTLALARRVGPKGTVYAFEPEDAARTQLAKTIGLHGMIWVSLCDHAIGARTEERLFHVSAIPGHSSLYALPDAEEATIARVQVMPLDDAIPSGQPIDVVKIDVEGAELDVLRGMDRLLAENSDLAIVAEYGPSHLERVGIEPKAWLGAFSDRGFVAYAIEEPTGAVLRTSLRALKGVSSVNLAFVKRNGAAEKRVKAL